MYRCLLAAMLLCLACTMPCSSAHAQQGPNGLPGGVTMGPSTISLGANVAVLKLPQGVAFVDKNQTRTLMEQSGDSPSPGLLGLVTEPGTADKDDWAVFMDFADVGYIKDGEADRFNADDLLRQMKEATAEQNEQRKAKGVPGLKVIGWYKPPAYDRARHTLNWAVIAQDEGSNERILNDTSVLFGRHGILIMTGVGAENRADMLHRKLMAVSGITTFNPGEDYASFRSGDRISDLTMTGLVTGGAAAAAYGAAKLGLLAKFGKLLAVAWKGILVALVALGGFFKKIWEKIAGGRGSDGPIYTGRA